MAFDFKTEVARHPHLIRKKKNMFQQKYICSKISSIMVTSKLSRSLAVATEGKGLVPFPGSPSRGACFVVQMPSAPETSVLLSSRSETAKLPVFVDWIADPVDSWVVPNSSMSRINQNHLKILVSRVLKF